MLTTDLGQLCAIKEEHMGVASVQAALQENVLWEFVISPDSTYSLIAV